MAETTMASILRGARERVGWSREVLAYHSGLSCAAIAQMESGRRQDVRAASLAALARALGVTIDYLMAGGAPATQPPLLEHRAFVYRSDQDFLATVVPYLRDGLQRSDAVLVVTTKPHIRRLRRALGDDAGDVEFYSSSVWYRSPIEALNKYQTYVRRRLDEGARWVRVVGEPVWAGRTGPEVEQWTRYEAVLNLSLAQWPAAVMCPYDARSLPPGIIEDAARTHPELADGPEVSVSPAYGQPERVLLGVSHA